MSNYHCIIRGCVGNNTGKTALYRFPRNSDISKKWIENIKFVYKNNTKTRVCSRHFEAKCFMKKKLVFGAVPTLLLGHNDDIPHTNNFDELLNRERRRCCVKNCKGTKRYFRFPNHGDHQKQWIRALQIKKCESVKNLFVCGQHFPTDCFGGKYLKKHAVPSLNLGQENSIDEFPPTLNEISESGASPDWDFLDVKSYLITEAVDDDITIEELPKVPRRGVGKVCEKQDDSFDSCQQCSDEKIIEFQQLLIQKDEEIDKLKQQVASLQKKLAKALEPTERVSVWVYKG